MNRPTYSLDELERLGAEVLAEPERRKQPNRRPAKRRDRKPPVPPKPYDATLLRPDERRRPDRSFRAPRERPRTCTAPACPRWPMAPALPDRWCCADCAARLDARAAEIIREAAARG